jgi:hypothetical protein
MTVMTKEKELALAERREYDSVTPEERVAVAKKVGRTGISYFINARHPETSSRAAALRSRLLLAGDRADLLWKRIDAGMPLTTACWLLAECEATHHKAGKRGDIQEVIKKRLDRYDREGSIRVVGGKVVRATLAMGRAERIASGQEQVSASRRVTPGSKRWLRGAARDAIAAWIAAFLPKGDERAAAWSAECLREVEVLLDSFARRFSRDPPNKRQLFEACNLLNVPRPRWGQRVDQEKARKHQRAALRPLHPDIRGDNSGTEAFQAINEAYQTIVAYNDSLGLNDDPFGLRDRGGRKKEKVHATSNGARSKEPEPRRSEPRRPESRKSEPESEPVPESEPATPESEPAAPESPPRGSARSLWDLPGIDASVQAVHVLTKGEPLCMFQTGVPSSWPAGHVWVAIDDAEGRSLAEEKLCVDCLAQVGVIESLRGRSRGEKKDVEEKENRDGT